MKRFYFSFGLLFWVFYLQAQISWPAGKKAAVILTYDDGLRSQRDIVMPQLEAKGFRGTFFLYGAAVEEKDIPEWREASRRGHELGNHSIYHPCLSGKETGNANHSSLCHSLECYSVKDILEEVRIMDRFLCAIDGKTKHPYAYPCGQTVAGGEDYSRALLDAGLAKYCRATDAREVITDAKNLNLAFVPTYSALAGCKAEELIRYVQEAIDRNGLAVIVFHGVGGDYLTVEAEEHQKLVDFLAAHTDEVWVSTFSEVLDYVTAQTNYTAVSDKEQTYSDDIAVKVDTTGGFITYLSPYYALSWAKEFPMMSYWNIESGGRNRRYQDKSLLRPGKGGCLVGKGKSSFGLKSSTVYENGKLLYKAIPFREAGAIDCRVVPFGDRQFSLSIQSLEKDIEGELFRIHTAPDVSPVSVWAQKTTAEPSSQYDTPVTFYTPKIVKAAYRLPAVLHFPDCGLVKVEADSPDVYLQEHIVPDYENTGLVLGPFNRGGHVWRKSVHLGSVILSFHAQKPVKKLNLSFTVLEENYPQIPGCDFSDTRFNGLKRCWQNAFTVNPEDQSMGDNILLNGIGHLALAFKADMLPFTPALSGTYSMNEALKTSIETAFREYVGDNNRLRCGYGWESTEVTLISLYDYLLTTNDWAFVRHYLPEIIRLVHGVCNTDIDGDGIFESPFHGNYMTPGRKSLNWWDDFAFGHKDAYVNLLAYRALSCMQEVLEALKLGEESAFINKRLESFRAVFDKTFYNPQSGMYAGWISLDGRMHDYQFTFISSMAINQGLVNQKRARKILRKMLKKMEEENYDFVYGIPGPLIPVSKEDKGTWEEMTRWGRYENGGLCGQTAYHFIQALYHVGMREEANRILFTMLATYEREYTHSGIFPGYLQSVDWRTKGGAPCGYNYLADNYYFLLAAVTGYYGITYPKLQTPPPDNIKE